MKPMLPKTKTPRIAGAAWAWQMQNAEKCKNSSPAWKSAGKKFYKKARNFRQNHGKSAHYWWRWYEQTKTASKKEKINRKRSSARQMGASTYRYR